MEFKFKGLEEEIEDIEKLPIEEQQKEIQAKKDRNAGGLGISAAGLGISLPITIYSMWDFWHKAKHGDLIHAYDTLLFIFSPLATGASASLAVWAKCRYSRLKSYIKKKIEKGIYTQPAASEDQYAAPEYRQLPPGSRL